jgi:hypothetical protein
VTRFNSPDGITEPAPLGVYIHGVVLEGARWDREEGVLKESNPSELHPALPVIQVREESRSNTLMVTCPDVAGGLRWRFVW